MHGFPGGSVVKNHLQCRRCKWHMRCGFHPWVGKTPWRRAWQPTPVFLPGESQGQRSLAGCCPWGRRVRHHWARTHTPNSRLSKQNPAHQPRFLSSWALINTHFATCIPTSSIDVFRAVAVLILSAWTSSSSPIGSSAFEWASLLWGEILQKRWNTQHVGFFARCQRCIKHQLL